MRNRLTGVITGLTLLSACAVPNPPSQQVGATQPQASPAQITPIGFKDGMINLGERYGQTVSFNDPRRVTDVVARCYRAQDNDHISAITQQLVRECLVEDYMAYRENLDVMRSGRPGNPYFTGDEPARRWAKFAGKAGFGSPDEMMKFVRLGYSYAMPAAQYVEREVAGMQLQLAPVDAHSPSILAGERP